jgi:hypothetical protein
MSGLQVNWIRNQDNNWCRLYTVNLANILLDNMSGVYIIWFNATGRNCVKVGQGNIRERLTQHRNDPEINAYKSRNLFATWARVANNQMAGVEAFLANELNPLVGERFPNVTPISVNLPA